jgi:hypothetical protein
VRRATSAQEGGEEPTRTAAGPVDNSYRHLLVLVLATVAAGEAIGSLLSSVGDREGEFSFRSEQPRSIDDLEDSHELGTGSLEVNLSDIELPEGTTEVEARVGDGALTVVPQEAAVRADAQAENGLVALLGRNVTGEDVEQDFEPH